MAYRFFLPLVFMVELNMISKSVIHAFLARADEPSLVLAAFNVSFTAYYTLMSATELTVMLSLSYVTDRQSLHRVLSFLALTLSPLLGTAVLVGLTPLGRWLYGDVFGASDAVIADAQICTLVLCLSAPVLVGRGLAFSMLMRQRRTELITASTLVRLLSLGLSLVLLPHVIEGAVVGAAALVVCMAAETVFAWAFAGPHYRRLERSGSPPPSGPALWRFSWPLALNQAAEMGVMFVITAFIGLLAATDLALAAFGVAHGLVGLVFGPLRNLAQTAQTLTRGPEDARVLVRFTGQLVAFFSLVALAVFHSALADLVLADVMGLTPALHAYVEPAVRIAFAMAPCWALAALFRGWLAGARSTRMLALTGALRLGAAAAVGSLAVFDPTLNGAVLGLSAWMLAYAVEALVLGLRLRTVPLVRSRIPAG